MAWVLCLTLLLFNHVTLHMLLHLCKINSLYALTKWYKGNRYKCLAHYWQPCKCLLNPSIISTTTTLTILSLLIPGRKRACSNVLRLRDLSLFVQVFLPIFAKVREDTLWSSRGRESSTWPHFTLHVPEGCWFKERGPQLWPRNLKRGQLTLFPTHCEQY